MIPEYRMSKNHHVNSQLMGSASYRLKLHQSPVIFSFQTFEICNSLTSVDVINSLERPVQPVHAQGLVDNPMILFNNPSDPCKVNLVGFSFLKLFAESSGSHFVFCNNQYARSTHIQSVYCGGFRVIPSDTT